MLRKSLSIFLLLTIVGLTSTAPLFAQNTQTKREKQTEKVKTKVRQLGLGERVKVKVKLYDDTSYQGYVSQANEDDFVVIDKAGNPHIVRYSDVRSIGGRNLSTGAKIAIGVGIGVGATILAIFIIIASLDD